MALGVLEHPGVLLTFRTWLGVELSILEPPSDRAAHWVGPSIDWRTMLLRHYGSPEDAYKGFYIQYREYVLRPRSVRRLNLPKQREDSFLFTDFGQGYPIAVDAVQIAGHDGFYVFRVFHNRAIFVGAYFSSIEAVVDYDNRSK
jgi:hypothetical protein